MSAAPRSVFSAIEASKTVGDLIEQQAARHGNRIFLIDPDSGAAVTYSDLLRNCRSVAAAVRSHGISKGDSIAYALANGRDCALMVLGLMLGGYRATAVNLAAGAKAIGYALRHSESRLIITERDCDELLDQALDGTAVSPMRLYAENVLSNGGQDGDGSDPDPLTAGSDGLLMYTSGTTGRPKGVVLTHQNLIAGGNNTATAHGLGPDDRALCVLPLYHINGLCVTLMGPLVSGGSVVMPHKFSSSAFWDLIRDHACTWFSVVPTHISYLLQDNGNLTSRSAGMKQVRFGRSASAPLSPDVQAAFEARFGIPIIETMGLTETAAQILSNPLPPAIRKSGSAGIAIGNDVMIAGKDQQEVSRAVEGEVFVRGPNIMRCYLKNPEATKDALTAGGWLRTGDLGRMDDDGYVFITGRLKELIIKGGENIAPREIDEALYAHPDITEAAAFARTCKNYGQRVEAAVVLRKNSTVSEADLLVFCRQRLGKFKTPDKIYFLDELPKGPSGKIQRVKIAEAIERRRKKPPE